MTTITHATLHVVGQLPTVAPGTLAPTGNQLLPPTGEHLHWWLTWLGLGLIYLLLRLATRRKRRRWLLGALVIGAGWQCAPVIVQATDFAINAPAVVFATKAGQLTYTATAATQAQVQWQLSPNLTTAQPLANPLRFTVKPSTTINWDPHRAGLPASLTATSNTAQATAALTVGGLPAIEVDGETTSQAGFRYTTTGLTTLGAALPPTRWAWRWELISTKMSARGALVPDDNNTQALSAYGEVTGAMGETTTLSDAAVAFSIPRASGLFKQLLADTANGHPRLLRLSVSGTPNGHPVTIVSNLAGFSVTKPATTLKLTSVPEALNWTLTPLAVYDRVPQTQQPQQPLTVQDTRTQPGWQLAARLEADAAFPFTLQIGQRGPTLTAAKPAAVIASGQAATFTQTPAITLTPTGTALTQAYHATITWTLASQVTTNSL